MDTLDPAEIRDPRDGGRPYWQDLTIDQRQAIVRPHYLSGDMTAAQMAATLFRGATRNAVIGAISRSPFARQAPKQRPRPKPTRKQRPQVVTKPKPKPIRVAPEDMPLAPPSADGFDPVTMTRPPLPGRESLVLTLEQLPERPGKACRFAVTGGYCGAPSGDHMYCRDHWPYTYSSEAVTRLVAAGVARPGGVTPSA